MIQLFLAMTFFNLLFLTATSALGYGVALGKNWGAYHQLFGALVEREMDNSTEMLGALL